MAAGQNFETISEKFNVIRILSGGNQMEYLNFIIFNLYFLFYTPRRLKYFKISKCHKYFSQLFVV